MQLTSQDFYMLFCNHKFKKISETIQDGFSGMYFVLRLLSESKDFLLAGDISQLFQVTTARTAVILNTLEKKGFVSKSKCEDDARKTKVEITSLGIEALIERKKKILGTIEHFLNKLDETEKVQFFDILKKLLIN